MTWESENEGPTWVPIINETEVKYGIPPNLLARVAYQERHFRHDIISCEVKSPAGALGLMQLEPQFWPTAGVSPETDIDNAGRFLSNLYQRFKDWQIALAAYNWGPHNVYNALEGGPSLDKLPHETQNYVTQIVADVPVPGVFV
jgi:soluble lytic murein transglycosylase-like protein